MVKKSATKKKTAWRSGTSSSTYKRPKNNMRKPKSRKY